MIKSRKRRPVFESLETLVLLNGAAAPGLHATTHVSTSGARIVLTGQVSGTWTKLPAVPDVGTEQILTGAGTMGRLGKVGATATLQLPGFIARGAATGLLRITNSTGSLRVQLTGPSQPGFSPAPATLFYVITGGTGRYTGAKGHGTIALAEPGQTFRMTFHP